MENDEFSSPGLSANLSERGTIKHNSVLEFVTSINYPHALGGGFEKAGGGKICPLYPNS